MGDVIDITDRLAREKEDPRGDDIEGTDGLIVERLRQVCLTRNCEMQLFDYFDNNDDDVRDFVFERVTRFISNDFGTLCPEDVEQNWRNLRDGGVVSGVYPLDEEQDESELRAWLMLDTDGQTLTMLMPEDY